jgi:hypothetical protein
LAESLASRGIKTIKAYKEEVTAEKKKPSYLAG